MYKPAHHVRECCDPKNDKQILEFEVKECHRRVEIPVNLRDIQRHKLN